jgi:hypothetical protein
MRYLLLFLLLTTSAYAQKEYSRWYFGIGYGLNFNAGSPPDTSQGHNSQLFYEGSAGICNASTGDLLFYTNGIDVYDNQHAIMPNGDGTFNDGLKGDYSGAQTALIIPMPEDPNRYYIFTADHEGYNDEGKHNGLHYSIVDLTLRSGHGDVSIKNVKVMDTCAEAQTAVKHPNGRDYWVIHHGLKNNYFYVRLVTPSGISDPVESQVGSTDYPADKKSIGSLKASPNGRKLAYSLYTGLVEIYDFDPCTGQISNPVTLKPASAGTEWAYANSFSPNSSKLYFNYTGALWQYDVSLPSTREIQNSGTIVTDPADPAYVFYDGGIQLGPDGKIYVRPSYLDPYLSVINNPDLPASACGLDIYAFKWPGGQSNSWIGLPNNIDANPEGGTAAASISGDTVLCEGESTVLSAPSGPYTYLWSNNETTQTITVSTPGSYWVQVIGSSVCGTGSDTVQVVVSAPPQPVVTPDGTSGICQGESITFTVSQPYAAYQWSNGATTQSITVSQAGTYTVTVTDANGCTGDTTVTLVVDEPPTVTITSDRTLSICEGDSVRLTAEVTGSASGFLWSTGETTPSIVVGRTGAYTVTATGLSGCIAIDSVDVVASEGKVVRLSLARDVLATPGDSTDVALRLEDAIDDIAPGSLSKLKIGYDTTMMRPLMPIDNSISERMTRGTLLQGWGVKGSIPTAGILELELIAPAGVMPITGTGELLRIPFATFITVGDTSVVALESDVQLMIDSTENPCLNWVTSVGHLRMELCGLNDRLIVLGLEKYALEPPTPNPFNPATEIRFTLGLDGPTRLHILDMAGRVVETLIDGQLSEGSHSITWNASTFPSGLYYCRVQSGDWSRTGSLLLVK